ncbi:Prolycopene isomerase chloroplastic [Bienertia sinuspersici]
MSIAFTAYFASKSGAITRKYIKDPQLLSFIDAKCFIVSTVNAMQTPMINASMVLCDRHISGINYPLGGVGIIAKSLAQGLVNQGSKIQYKANVVDIILEHGKAKIGLVLMPSTCKYNKLGLDCLMELFLTPEPSYQMLLDGILLGLSPTDYNTKKELIADEIISRLEKNLFPGLKSSIIFKEVLLWKMQLSIDPRIQSI